jgi:hypothetical protein
MCQEKKKKKREGRKENKDKKKIALIGRQHEQDSIHVVDECGLETT